MKLESNHSPRVPRRTRRLTPPVLVPIVSLLVVGLIAAGAYRAGLSVGMESADVARSQAEEALLEADEALDTAEEACALAADLRGDLKDATATVAVLEADNDALSAELAKKRIAAKPTVRVVKVANTYSGEVPALIRRIAHEQGLGTADAEALVVLAKRESSFDPSAHSKDSECHGLFQLSAGMAHGNPWTDPVWNTKRAIRYIRGRYGTPRAALAHSHAKGWY